MNLRSAVLFAGAGLVASQYTPDWPSLDSRPLPTWYDEAKVGIFIHWGVFSVPSWGPPSGGASGEWFWWEWQGSKDPDFINFVAQTEAPGFSYPDYAPRFTAELWDPAQWAQIFANSGAKYVVLTSKHHEGWTNWQSPEAWNWNAVENGPHRDLVGDLATAVRAANLTFGLYHSLFEWFNPIYLADKASGYTSQNYVAQVAMPQLHEIVNRYQPDVVWSDGDWEAADTYWNSTEFLAWLFNDSPVKNTVVVNDRWGAGDACKHGSYYTCDDRYNPGVLQKHKWENCFTIDKYSWGFRRNAQYPLDFLTSDDIITELVSTVACGGNILVNVGPSHDGTILPLFTERLADMGAWLSVNGEAIYSTVPWRAQNDTVAPSVWYTTAGDAVYAISLNWPANNVLTLGVPQSSSSTNVSLVGSTAQLKWTASGASGLSITIPPLNVDQMPCDYAWTFKLTGVK